MGVIDAIMPKDARIIERNKLSVVVSSSKEDKEKLLESLQALDEIQ
jgi:hypothetical protein